MDNLDLLFEEEKKTPKQPVEVLGIWGNGEFMCPNCSETEGVKILMNQCPWCGQALKWNTFVRSK